MAINKFKIKEKLFGILFIATSLMAAVLFENDSEIAKEPIKKVNNYYFLDANGEKVKINYTTDEKSLVADYIDNATAKIIENYYEEVLSVNLFLPGNKNKGKTSIYQNIKIEKVHSFIKPIYKVRYEKITPIDMKLNKKVSYDYLEVDNTFFLDFIEFALSDFTLYFMDYKKYVKMSKILEYKKIKNDCENSMNKNKCFKMNIEKGKKIKWEW